MLNFSNAKFRYEPFPIGFATDVIPPSQYEELANTFPPVEMLKMNDSVGKKYFLSEWSAPETYYSFVTSVPAWRRLHDYITGGEFIRNIIDTLYDSNIDFGFKEMEVIDCNNLEPWDVQYKRRIARKLKDLAPFGKHPPGILSGRLEFSILPGTGGYHYPHTDQPRKVISLVLSMAQEGEWDPAWGGGTAICRPKDPRNYVNQFNRYLSLDEVDITHTYPFVPNGCVIFVKTFNSWHVVEPVHAGSPDVLRKSLTINVDYSPRNG